MRIACEISKNFWHNFKTDIVVVGFGACATMDTKTYLKISAMNLAFLLLGLVIGILVMSSTTGVHAQTKDSATIKVDRAPISPPLDPNAEYVTPGVGLGGPVVTNTLLANRIACDRLQVNGFEPLKLNDAVLSLLIRKGIVTPEEVTAVVNAGKAEHPLRIKPQ